MGGRTVADRQDAEQACDLLRHLVDRLDRDNPFDEENKLGSRLASDVIAALEMERVTGEREVSEVERQVIYDLVALYVAQTEIASQTLERLEWLLCARAE